MPRNKVSMQSEESEVWHNPADHKRPKTITYDNDASKGVRGIVHIFNYYEFEDSEDEDSEDEDSEDNDNFPEGESEGNELMKVFTTLKYKVKLHCNLTKAKTDQAFRHIQRTEGLASENVMIFFILSHGDGEFTFQTSDGKVINVMEKMKMFRKDKCDAMAYCPKIWFGDFCRGDKDQRGVSWYEKKKKSVNAESVKCYGDKEVLTNSLYIMSSGVGFASVSPVFSTAVCEMFKEKKYSLDDNWVSELNRKLRKREGPNSARHYYDPFPGQLFDGKFSFRYDVESVLERKFKNL